MEVVAQIEKNYGKGSIMALGSQPAEDIPSSRPAAIQPDMALGVGGYPRTYRENLRTESRQPTTLNASNAIAQRRN